MAKIETYGTFTKDKRTRTARTTAEAVQLRFDGWREVVIDPPDEPAGEGDTSTSGDTTAKRGSGAGK